MYISNNIKQHQNREFIDELKNSNNAQVVKMTSSSTFEEDSNNQGSCCQQGIDNIAVEDSGCCTR